MLKNHKNYLCRKIIQIFKKFMYKYFLKLSYILAPSLLWIFLHISGFNKVRAAPEKLKGNRAFIVPKARDHFFMAKAILSSGTDTGNPKMQMDYYMDPKWTTIYSTIRYIKWWSYTAFNHLRRKTEKSIFYCEETLQLSYIKSRHLPTILLAVSQHLFFVLFGSLEWNVRLIFLWTNMHKCLLHYSQYILPIWNIL